MNSETSLSSRLRCWLTAAPPELMPDYDRPAYARFMQAEIARYSPRYVRKRVEIHGEEELLTSLADRPLLLVLLHHGSWLLVGGAVRHLLGVPYTVIASRRNFKVMTAADRDYWSWAHSHVADFYRLPPFYTDQSPRAMLRWLQPGRVLGVALDVREYNQHYREQQIPFGTGKIWVQSGPARLARLARARILPSAIHYDPRRRKHLLRFFPAIDPLQSPDDSTLTRQLFQTLEPTYFAYEQQSFFDLPQVFSSPHQPIPD